jgi:hypothetical protein
MSGPSEKISQAEKRAVLQNDKLVRDQQTHMKLAELFWENERRQRDTFHNRTQSDLNLENQGRFAKQSNVTGSAGAVEYPRLPAGNPWADAPLGNEEPLGYSIDDHTPVGEVFELEQSFGIREVASPLPPDAGAVERALGRDSDCSTDNSSLDATGPDAHPGVASSAPNRTHLSVGRAGPVPLPLTRGGLR